MALAAPFPPWLAVTPETYTGAMGAGAKIGLAARAEDIRQQTAADRLKLAYEQLAAKEEMAAQALQGKMELAGAQLELKDKAMQMTAALRERGLDQQWENYKSLIESRGGTTAKANIHWGKDNQPYMYNAETGRMELVPGVPPLEAKPGKEGTVTITEPPIIQHGVPGPTITRRMPQSEYDRQLEKQRIANAARAFQAKSQAEWQSAADEAEKKLFPGFLRRTFMGGPKPSELTPTPQGRIVTDRKGKKWKYTGTMDDPKKDRDESHWEAVE